MRHKLVMAVLILLAVPGAFYAAVDVETRERGLPHCCDDGTLVGQSCNHEVPDACPEAVCALALDASVKFKGTLTLMADEDVGNFDSPTDTRQTASVILQVKGRFGEGDQQVKNPILSQSYQSESNPSFPPDYPDNVLADDSQPFNEGILFSLSLDPDRLRSRTVDTEIADALRQLFGTTGTPVILKAKSLQITDHGGDAMGSTLTAKVLGRFVNPQGKPCQ